MRTRTSAFALGQYAAIDVHTGVHDATPHRLIQMLLDGALARVASAHGHMQRGETAKKGEDISWCLSIINGLRESLNAEAGGEIAANLSKLYEYMSGRLLHANLHDDLAALREVHGLLTQIRGGWDGIREQVEGVVEVQSALA